MKIDTWSETTWKLLGAFTWLFAAGRIVEKVQSPQSQVGHLIGFGFLFIMILAPKAYGPATLRLMAFAVSMAVSCGPFFLWSAVRTGKPLLWVMGIVFTFVHLVFTGPLFYAARPPGSRN